MNEAWYVFYGRQLHMSRPETMLTKYGELLDQIACLAIFNGSAVPKKKKKKLSYDEAMALR